MAPQVIHAWSASILFAYAAGPAQRLIVKEGISNLVNPFATTATSHMKGHSSNRPPLSVTSLSPQDHR
ncbi:hypothetical protein AB0D12_37005 [Streptomyces sp. NPDC048479]|uniref:hypothetical protein n=1 Tax=Streptomyces sp. NPDC048479 TaxID=3154725 RepID=UPI003426B803